MKRKLFKWTPEAERLLLNEAAARPRDWPSIAALIGCSISAAQNRYGTASKPRRAPHPPKPPQPTPNFCPNCGYHLGAFYLATQTENLLNGATNGR